MFELVFTFSHCHTVLQEVARIAGICKSWIFGESFMDSKFDITVAITIRIAVDKTIIFNILNFLFVYFFAQYILSFLYIFIIYNFLRI
jgi:hypothetical protein